MKFRNTNKSSSNEALVPEEYVDKKKWFEQVKTKT